MDEKEIIDLIKEKINFLKDVVTETTDLESKKIFYAKLETLEFLLYEIEKGS